MCVTVCVYIFVQCMPCGATVGGRSVLGVCVSENTCCVAHLGCFVNTEESKVCALENHLSTPCRLEGPPCGSDGQDVCAVEGICCAGRTYTSIDLRPSSVFHSYNGITIIGYHILYI